MENTFTEQQLLSLMAESDKEAFSILYRKYWNDLYCAAYKRLRNSEQAEDIVQEIFTRLWERRKSLEVENLSAYLHTAVRYKVYNYVMRDAASETFYEPFETIASHPVSADSAIIEKELLQLIDSYIEALPRKRKKIFTLYFEEDLSTGEIARRLKISQKTVQNQLGAAMNGLRTQILPVCIYFAVLVTLFG